MKNKVLKAMIAVILIIAITMADFIFVGMSLVTYALEGIEDSTNHENVKFAAYFKTGNVEAAQAGYEVNSSDMKLYVKVEVKNSGYFDGTITLEDSNFELKQDKLPEGVSSIEENKIVLDRVRTGNSIELELNIEPVISESYEEKMLGMESMLKLKGEYYKDGAEKYISIEQERKVTLDLLVPSNIETTLEAKVITNKTFGTTETTKKLVQLEIDSTVLDNIYPIKTTTFEIALPQGVEFVEVISKGTYATNGEADKRLEENKDYIWDKTNKQLQIKIENVSNNGKISWKKDVEDSIIVTLLLTENAELGETEYSIKSGVELYGKEGKQLGKQLGYNLSQEADGRITISHDISEEIYKGKLYSKEDREYEITTKLEINHTDLLQGASINEKTIYKSEKQDINANNIEYQNTVISKSEFDKVLGTTGKILIKDQSGNEIKEIKAVDFDTNENITIIYAEGIRGLVIEITQPEETGIIRFKHTKIIKGDSTLSKENIDMFKYLAEIAEVKYDVIESEFIDALELKEISSEVALTIKNKTISSEGNKEIPISITLKTDNEKYELFENPIFLVTMPEGVTIDSVTNGEESVLYGGLKISKLEAINEKQILIEVSGNQTEYVKSNINTQINFTAKVNIEKLMPNKIDKITMQYQNKGEIYNLESEGINIIASNLKVVTHLKVENYNGEGATLEKYSDNKQEIKGELPIENTEEIEAIVTYTVINNYDSEIVSLQATEATFYDYRESKKILSSYGENNISIKAGEMKQFTQRVKIPADLYYGEKVDVLSLMEYTYSSTKYTLRNNINIATEGKEGLRDSTIIDDKIKIETFAQLGDGTAITENDEVFDEQIISYIMEVTNISNETISNVIVTNKQENGNIYDLTEIEMTNYVESSEPRIEHRYGELDTDTKTFESFNLQPGETKELLCRVVTKKTDTIDITSANINILAEGIEEQNIAKISNNVKETTLKTSTEKLRNEEVPMHGDETLQISNRITNLTDEIMTDIKVKMYLSEGLRCVENSTIVEALNLGDEVIDILSDIEYNKENNYVQLNIENLNAGEEIKLVFYTHILPLEIEQLSSEVSAYAKINDIVSNNIEINVKQLDTKLSVTQTINIAEGQKLKNGETAIITGEITNIGHVDSIVTIEDCLPEGLEIKRVYLKKGNQITDVTEKVVGSLIYIDTESDVKTGETLIIEIEVTVNTSKIVQQELKNQILAEPTHGNTAYSNEISILIDSEVDTNMNGQQPDSNPEYEEPENKDPEIKDPDEGQLPDDGKQEPDIPNTEKPDDGKDEGKEQTYSISGYAWVDENENGVRDEKESIKNVIVKIVDLNNKNSFLKNEDGNEIEIKTNESGYYKINDIPKGKYNIIFKYNTNMYELKENTGTKDYIIESTNEKVAITNEINLEENKTIDLALIELTEFNLKIEKYISKVIVQTANETKTSTYTNKQLAREEIQRKYIQGATVLVEYTLEVSNIGEMAGYITEIIDYLPKDMKFYSELNEQWYMGDDENLYNTTLSNVAINPGETKTIKLVLSKTMTKQNTGVTTNIAEISNAMNIKGYADTDLSNNQSKAEVIINPATGAVVTYLIAIPISIAIIAVGVYIIRKKVIGKEIK